MALALSAAVLIGVSSPIDAANGRVMESHILAGAPQRQAILNGAYVNGIALAYRDWSSNVSAGKYKIADQNVMVNMVEGNLWVRFVPRYTSSDKLHVGGESALGKEVLYVIDRSGAKILRRLYGE